MSSPMDLKDAERQVRELTDQLAAFRSEFARVEAALDAARAFGAEQFALASSRQKELQDLRSTRTFRYSAPVRRIYGKGRRLAGRLRRRVRSR
jgi:hypothetical protein